MDQPPLPRKKFFYGWIITGLVFINLATAYGAQYSFGIFFPSLIEEFQWSRHDLAGVFSLYTLLYNFLGMFLGKLADRFGPRLVLIYGSLCLGIGIAWVSQVSALWQLYVVYGLLAALGMSAAYMTASPTIVKWFVEKRGLAMGLAQAGHGIGVICIPPLTGFLIVAFGWRLACMLLGLGVLAILFTMALFLVSHPEKLGLQPDGRANPPPPKAESSGSESSVQEPSFTLVEAMHTAPFWTLNAMFFANWIFVFFPLVHLVVLAIDLGISRESSFLAVSILGGFSTLGRLLLGSISDRLGRKPILVFCFSLQIFSWLWLNATTTTWMLFLFSMVFGFSYGGIGAIYPAIVGDYFGRRNAASLIGAVLTIAGTGAAIGPVLGGYIHDWTASYQLAYLLGALTNGIAFVLVFLAKPPRKAAACKH